MSVRGQRIERMAALLRDVKRSGGVDRRPHLLSHGHARATLDAATRRGYLRENRGSYEITASADAFFVWYGVWKAAA